MVKNNNVLLLVGVLVVGLIAGLIGGAIGSSITGDVTVTNNAASYRIRPQGTYADTWLPFSDGSVYLTSIASGSKNGGIVFRKWTGGTSFTELAKIDSNGNLAANNIYTKAEIDAANNKILGEIGKVSTLPSTCAVYGHVYQGADAEFKVIDRNYKISIIDISSDSERVGSSGKAALSINGVIVMEKTPNGTEGKKAFRVGDSYTLADSTIIKIKDFANVNYVGAPTNSPERIGITLNAC
jgi:hypothetical protein